MPHTTHETAWRRTARKRRFILGTLILIPSAVASSYVGSVLPDKGSTPLELAIIIVYSILFAWISVGFWTAIMGCFTLLRRYDRFTISRVLAESPESDDIPRTAVLFPICNEDTPPRHGRNQDHLPVTATNPGRGPVRHPHPERLQRSGQMGGGRNRLGHAGGRVERAGPHLLPPPQSQLEAQERQRGRFLPPPRAGLHLHGGLRRGQRHVRGNPKRHGPHHGATPPRSASCRPRPPVSGATPCSGGLQQFANRVYGPMFAAGLSFWQLGDAQYWGHNALIRIEPFMRHCGLPRLSGKPPLGGDILSHDFVEAALMRRAHWGVWLAFDLPGSWEESPPNLLSELKRDRRWCQGNLQHLRLLFSEGLFPAHRILFLNGAMSYASALLWFLFLMLSSAEAVLQAIVGPSYFTATKSLFPAWPVWQPLWALVLLTTTGVLLFLPKILSYLLIVFKTRGSRLFGGPLPVTGEHCHRSDLFRPAGPHQDALPQQIRLHHAPGQKDRLGLPAARRPAHHLERRLPLPRRRRPVRPAVGRRSLALRPVFLLVDRSHRVAHRLFHAPFRAHQPSRTWPLAAPQEAAADPRGIIPGTRNPRRDPLHRRVGGRPGSPRPAA